MTDWLNFPRAASAHAAEIDSMTAMMHWVMLFLFVGWSAFFLYTLFRFHKSRHPKADYAGVRSHSSSYLEGAIVIIEAVFLLGFAFPLWALRVNADRFPQESESTIVRVVGEQFAWNVHYPGQDGRFGRSDIKLVGPANPLGLDSSDPNGKDDLTTINLLNLPVDKPVIVYLTSKDVIHSFGIPEMRVKQDAVPGMEIPVWWIPNVAGDYEIACSQLCGLGHYRMRGFVKIQTDAEFQAWLQEQRAAQ